jgi:integrase
LKWQGKHYRLSLDKELKRHVGDKTEARREANRIKDQIRAGRFRQIGTSASIGLTFGDVVKEYVSRHVETPTRRPGAQQVMRWHLEVLKRTEVPAAEGTTVRLEQKSITAISKADVEAIRASRRATGRKGVKGGEAGINRLLARLRHLFSWAIAEGYVDQTPFRRHGVTVVKLETRAETARTRRLVGDEEARLLQHANIRLRALIVAALHTGCRLGELLSLQWGQIRRDEQDKPRWIALPADKTKTNGPRQVPIGTRLAAELEMRQHDPAGQRFGPEHYVFGDGIGRQARGVRTAWKRACAAAGIVDLHFHDLRREFASRLLESGTEAHTVRAFLGHANISTTSRYLASGAVQMERAIKQLESRVEQSDEQSLQSVANLGLPQAGGVSDPQASKVSH